MLSKSEENALVDQLKRVLIQFFDQERYQLVDAALRLGVSLVQSVLAFEDARFDDTDAASCGKGGIAAETKAPEKFLCPRCHRSF